MSENTFQPERREDRTEGQTITLNPQQREMIVDMCTLFGLNPHRVLDAVGNGQLSGVSALLDDTETTREMNFADSIILAMSDRNTREVTEEVVQEATIHFIYPRSNDSNFGIRVDDETRTEMRARLYQTEHPGMSIEDARRESYIEYGLYRNALIEHRDAPLSGLYGDEQKVMARERGVDAVFAGAYLLTLANGDPHQSQIVQPILERIAGGDRLIRDLAVAVSEQFEPNRQGVYSVQNWNEIGTPSLHTIAPEQRTLRIRPDNRSETNADFRIAVEQVPGADTAGVRWCLERFEQPGGASFTGVNANDPSVIVATALHRNGVTLNDLDNPNNENIVRMQAAIIYVQSGINLESGRAVNHATRPAADNPQILLNSLVRRYGGTPEVVLELLGRLSEGNRTSNFELDQNDPNLLIARALDRQGVRVSDLSSSDITISNRIRTAFQQYPGHSPTPTDPAERLLNGLVRQYEGNPDRVRWLLEHLEQLPRSERDTTFGLDANDRNLLIARELNRHGVRVSDLSSNNRAVLNRVQTAFQDYRPEYVRNPPAVHREPVNPTAMALQHVPQNDAGRALAARIEEVPGTSVPRVIRYLRALEEVRGAQDRLRGNDPNLVVAGALYNEGVRYSRIMGFTGLQRNEQTGLVSNINAVQLQFEPSRRLVADAINEAAARAGCDPHEVNIYLSRLAHNDRETRAASDRPRAPLNDNERLAIEIYQQIQRLGMDPLEVLFGRGHLTSSNEDRLCASIRSTTTLRV